MTIGSEEGNSEVLKAGSALAQSVRERYRLERKVELSESSLCMMRSRSCLFLCAVALVAAVACSRNDDRGSEYDESVSGGGSSGAADGVGGGGGSSPAGGGEAASGGTSGVGGGMAAGGSDVSTGGLGGLGGGAGEELFVPEEVLITRVDGGSDGVHLTASTFLSRPSGPEFYARVRNDESDPICDAAISVEFFDQEEQSIAATIAGVYTSRVYERGDEPGQLIACIDPGEIGMVSFTELPAEITFEDVGLIAYSAAFFFSSFLPFELVPVEGLVVLEVEEVAGAFSGRVENRLQAAVLEPAVVIFPVTQEGRPLGVAQTSGDVTIPPGESWAFTTNALDDVGVDTFAYASGSMAP